MSLPPHARLKQAGAVVVLFLIAACSSAPSRRRPETAPPSRLPAPKEAQPAQRQPVATPAKEPRERAPLQIPSLLRVGLATDEERVVVPCCDGVLVAAAGDRVVARAHPLVVTPAHPSVSLGQFGVQVAALKDAAQAKNLASEVSKRVGVGATAVFDAGLDLYRVRVGNFPDRATAETLRRRLVGLGLADAWVVARASGEVSAGLRVSQGDHTEEVEGRWLTLESDRHTVSWDGKHYRGRLLVYLNDRGLLNVINELPVEEYLRGVVPREMGPSVYDRIEALKAQAVAARTYTLRNKGEFAGEGYDICATPRCQVYGGMDAEQPLTDEAIRQTAGEVLVYDGELVDALYSSTCGGHTEDVEIIFPLKHEPYLRGVPCMEGGGDPISGRPATDPAFPVAVVRDLLPVAPEVAERESAEARFRRLAVLAGLPFGQESLPSLSRRDVQAFVASVFDLAVDARMFVSASDLAYLLSDPPPGWRTEELRLAAYLMQSGLLAIDGRPTLDATAIDDLLWQLALYLHVVERHRVTYMGLDGSTLQVRSGSEDMNYGMSTSMFTYRDTGHGVRASALRVLPGDRLDLYLDGGVLLAIVHHVDLDGAADDRSSSFSHWTRFRSDAELAARVRERYPGMEFTGFQILRRGVSGRVGAIRLDGRGGTSQVVEGLAVRWTLDVPDTLFTARHLAPAGKPPGWLFTGRGWGHGVGMCQVGAFGMAQRGQTYREILQHYYSGVEIESVQYR
jgi:stage II sporulation protein D